LRAFSIAAALTDAILLLVVELRSKNRFRFLPQLDLTGHRMRGIRPMFYGAVLALLVARASACGHGPGCDECTCPAGQTFVKDTDCNFAMCHCTPVCVPNPTPTPHHTNNNNNNTPPNINNSNNNNNIYY
jgi:hypothetical protein